MVKCPKCKKEIESLICEFEETVWQDFTVDEKGNVDYTAKDNCDGGTDARYICPECEHTIAESEEVAIRFLQGK